MSGNSTFGGDLAFHPVQPRHAGQHRRGPFYLSESAALPVAIYLKPKLFCLCCDYRLKLSGTASTSRMGGKSYILLKTVLDFGVMLR